MATILSTRQTVEKNRSPPRFLDALSRVDTCMTNLDTPVLTDAIRRILGGPHLSVLATTNADGQPQTSVIFVKREGDDILFSTIKGRRKTTNMLRDPHVNLLLHTLPVGGEGSTYATISGTVELTDDPGGAMHQALYDIHMGGATPPPEPGDQRVIVRIRPQKAYQSPYGSTPAE
jgi:PPOX class probable F420-dependent enzyme